MSNYGSLQQEQCLSFPVVNEEKSVEFFFLTFTPYTLVIYPWLHS